MQIKDHTATLLSRVLFLMLYCFISGCAGTAEDEDRDLRPPSLQPILGIDFYEVRRSLDNGLAYDSLGLVQEADSRVKFTREAACPMYAPASVDSDFNFE